MKRKNTKTMLILALLLLGITLGYAYLTTNLNINGTANVNRATWDIHFENVQVSSGSVTAATPVIDTAKTTVSYTVTLAQPGDYYEFTVDAKNAGTIDGMINSFSSKLNGSEITNLPAYLTYSVTYLDGSQIKARHKLSVGSTETYKVRIGYNQDVSASELPTTNQSLSLSFTVNYGQADDTAIDRMHYTGFVYSFSPFAKSGNTLSTIDNYYLEDNYSEIAGIVYLRHYISNGVIEYSELVLDYQNQKYYIRGGDGGAYFNNNKETVNSLLGADKCETLDGGTYRCIQAKSGNVWYGIVTVIYPDGRVHARDGGSKACSIEADGTASCAMY